MFCLSSWVSESTGDVVGFRPVMAHGAIFSTSKLFSDDEPVSLQRGRRQVGEGPQRDSPSHSLSNRQICKDTFPVVLPAVPLVALPVRWDRSTHVRTSGIPAGIPGSTDTLLQTADRQHCVTKIAISVSEIIFVS
jgi:hypothetical protein